MTKRILFRPQFWMLMGLMLVVMACTACGGFMALWTVGNVALGAVGVALTALSAALTPAQVQAIQNAIVKVQALWNDLKAAVTSYTSNAAAGSLAAVEAVIASLQAALPDVEAAANVQNPVVKAIIAAVLAASYDVLNYIAQNVLPQTPVAMAEYKAGNKTPATAVDQAMGDHAKLVKANLEAAFDASGADAKTIKSLHDHVEHGMAHHIGPIRI